MPSIVRTAAMITGLLAALTVIPGASASIPQAKSFGGVPSVGALFTDSGGIGTHFCTAAVVSSPLGNLAITSAHCLNGQTPGSVAFAPGYNGGYFPYGAIPVTAFYTNSAWSSHRNINDDVAFLQLRSAIQQQTGALTLATGLSPRSTKVIGYPDGKGRPVECTTGATWLRKGQQMKFVCGGYPDGTSGGPWIISGSRVYGVIGGYQQGGLVSWISYSPYFGSTIRSLYNSAVAQDTL